jgi:virginiamycin B lyase
MDGRSSGVLLAVAIAAVVAETAPAIQTAQNSSPSRPVAELPFSRLTPDASIALELEPGAALSGDALWLPQRQPAALLRVDPKNTTAGKPIELGTPPCGSLVISASPPDLGSAAPPAPGDVWVPLCAAGTIARVNAHQGNVTATVPLPVAEPKGTLAWGTGSVWVVSEARGVLSRIDPATNAPVAEVYVAARPFAVAAQDDVVWVTSEAGNVLTRVDGHTNAVVEVITVGPRPGHLAIGEGAVWTLNRGDGSLSRVDLKTNKVVATIAIDPAVADGVVAVGEGAVWVSARGAPLVRIDPRTNRVTHRFSGAAGGMVLAGHNAVWVAAGPKLTWRIDPKLIASLRP